jgi:gluconate 2-dehydrogenase gamma chain
VVRLIPPDELGPGALEAGVPNYIDLQLHGAWGAGERLYRSGPWSPGKSTQGYQLPFTPAELFRTALRGIRNDLEHTRQTAFEKLPGNEQDAYLTALQTTQRDLEGVPSNVFFESLLAMTIEGYFCDPVYGGNKDMAAWKMIGFPGAYAAYYDLVDQYGVAFRHPPRSLAEVQGHVHVMPDIPATAPVHVHPKGR